MDVILLGVYDLKGCLEVLRKDFVDIVNGTKKNYRLPIDSGYNGQIDEHLRKILFTFFSFDPSIQQIIFKVIVTQNKYLNLGYDMKDANYKLEFTTSFMQWVYGLKTKDTVEITSFEYAFFIKLLEMNNELVYDFLKDNKYFPFIIKIIKNDFGKLNVQEIESLDLFFTKSRIFLPSLFITTHLINQGKTRSEIYDYFTTIILPNLQTISYEDLKFLILMKKNIFANQVEAAYIKSVGSNGTHFSEHKDEVVFRYEDEIMKFISINSNVLYEDYVIPEISYVNNIPEFINKKEFEGLTHTDVDMDESEGISDNYEILYPTDGAIVPSREIDIRLQISTKLAGEKVYFVLTRNDGREILNSFTTLKRTRIRIPGDGKYTLEVWMKDSGNSEKKSVSFTVKIDNTQKRKHSQSRQKKKGKGRT